MTTWKASTTALCALTAMSAMAQSSFVKIHTGEHWIWYARSDQYAAHQADIDAVFEYADKAFSQLVEDWGLSPRQQRYNLLVWDKTGGGFATGDIGEVHNATGEPSPGIGCSFDAFYNESHGIKGYWAPVLITHEMVNLFTGLIVGGGWPRDWWADDRSPFPLMTSVEIEFQLRPLIAAYHLEESRGDPLVGMFMKMKDRFGWEMFRRAFQLAIDDGINWDRFGGNPSALRTAYVSAYLELGAGTDLAPAMSSLVPNYDHATVLAILSARKKWRSRPADSSLAASDKEAYLSGRYSDVR